jgi:hypothetical protein
VEGSALLLVVGGFDVGLGYVDVAVYVSIIVTVTCEWRLRDLRGLDSCSLGVPSQYVGNENTCNLLLEIDWI